MIEQDMTRRTIDIGLTKLQIMQVLGSIFIYGLLKHDMVDISSGSMYLVTNIAVPVLPVYSTPFISSSSSIHPHLPSHFNAAVRNHAPHVTAG